MSAASAQTVYNVPPDAPPASIGLNDVLNLDAGGSVPDNFVANSGSTIYITGGTMGRFFSATGATVTIDGGVVGSRFTASTGTNVTLNSGTIGDGGGSLSGFVVGSGAAATLNGGTLSVPSRLEGGSTLTINSAEVTGQLSAQSGSNITVNSGTIHQFFSISNNATVNIFGGTFNTLNTGSLAKITLHGTDFRFNGELLEGFDPFTHETVFALPDVGVFTGTLSDGTPFVMYDPDATYLASVLKLKQTAAPTGPAMIHVPTDSAPYGIHDGQTLVLENGGSLGTRFNAGRGSTLVINGGTVGPWMEAAAANVTVNGGAVSNIFTALLDSTVAVNNGKIGEMRLYNSAELEVAGGSIGVVAANLGTNATISGGIFGSFRSSSGSQAMLVGSDFRLDGLPIPGLSAIGDIVAIDVPANSAISAILADGTPMIINQPGPDVVANGTLTLKLAAQTPAGPANFNVPADPAPAGLRPGQTLLLNEGGTLPDHFTAIEQSTIVMNGGTMPSGVKTLGATVTINDGTVGVNFAALAGTNVTVNGGTIGSGFSAYNGSVLTVHGGTFSSLNVSQGATATLNGGNFPAFSTSIAGTATINGGTFNHILVSVTGNVEFNAGSSRFRLAGGANATINGGTFGHWASVSTGSHLTINGGDFRIDGVPVAGLETTGNSVPINVTSAQLLSGTLADGTPFAFMGADDDTLADGTITLRAAPTAPVGPTLIEVPAADAPLGIRDGQTLVLRGGTLPDNFNAGRGSSVRIHGGTVGTNFEAVDADVLITGGVIAGEFDAFRDSTIDIYGHNFKMLNNPIPGLINAGDTVTITQRGNMLKLSATLLDGNPFELQLCTATSPCYTDAHIGNDFVDASATLRLHLAIAGDYNMDGEVDNDDYFVWQSTFGSTSDLDADGDFSGGVDAIDYVIWRNNLGSSLTASGGAATSANVPEPVTLLLAAAALAACQNRRRAGRDLRGCV